MKIVIMGRSMDMVVLLFLALFIGIFATPGCEQRRDICERKCQKEVITKQDGKLKISYHSKFTVINGENYVLGGLELDNQDCACATDEIPAVKEKANE